MAVQQEIKSQLAKLLATEDIVVEHRRVSTAQFNVHTRILILPLWEKASNYVYDMLVGHEVGHALFTPDRDPPVHIPPQFVNVVEDVRIEKLMKRKYMGIAKSFYKGDNELYEQDFFELDGEDITDFNLADRANLYFKVGSFLPLAFSSAEKQIIDLINACDTLEDTLSAAEALYNFCKQKDSPEKEQRAKEDALADIEFLGSDIISDATDNLSSILDADSSDAMEDRTVRNVDSSRDSVLDTSIDIEIQTADALDNKLRDLVNSDGVENVYIEVPKVNLDTIVASNKEIHEEIDQYWKFEERMWRERSKEVGGYLDPGFEEVDAQFIKFKGDAQKEVSYLVKEFECRKSASAYARSSVSKTGILNTSILHQYKFNEDLFKKISVIPDGKNHGLVFILDWSGSMQGVLLDTLKQLYNLLWFCKKVQIPFEVYAFTNEWSRRTVDYNTGIINPIQLKPHYEEKEGVFKISEEFSLMNLFTSKVNGANLEHQMINIWRLGAAFLRKGDGVLYSWPARLLLSGTPLNEALISLHQLLPQFQKDNGVEKVQCIILSDGEAQQIPYHKQVQRHWESKPYLGCRNVNPNTCFIRDRRVGKTYKIGYKWHQFTDNLLINLKDNFPKVNFIGIRVLINRDVKQFIRMHEGEDEKNMIEWKRNRSFIIRNSGYDAYFALSASALAEDASFDVEEDATKAQIKKAFVKSLKTKKLNKKVLGEFIELVV